MGLRSGVASKSRAAGRAAATGGGVGAGAGGAAAGAGAGWAAGGGLGGAGAGATVAADMAVGAGAEAWVSAGRFAQPARITTRADSETRTRLARRVRTVPPLTLKDLLLTDCDRLAPPPLVAGHEEVDRKSTSLKS